MKLNRLYVVWAKVERPGCKPANHPLGTAHDKNKPVTYATFTEADRIAADITADHRGCGYPAEYAAVALAPWIKVSRAGYLTEKRAYEPGPGVWVRSQEVPMDQQHTIESIAIGGCVQHVMHAYHGQGRNAAWQLAVGLAKKVR